MADESVPPETATEDARELIAQAAGFCDALIVGGVELHLRTAQARELFARGMRERDSADLHVQRDGYVKLLEAFDLEPDAVMAATRTLLELGALSLTPHMLATGEIPVALRPPTA